MAANQLPNVGSKICDSQIARQLQIQMWYEEMKKSKAQAQPDIPVEAVKKESEQVSVFDEAPENLSLSSLVIDPIPNQALVESKVESVPLSKTERSNIRDS